jgi:cytochrome c-type biogenesis protein
VTVPAPTKTRSRVLLGSLLFVLGFSAVFVAYGLLFGALGEALVRYQQPITRILGVVVIALGLAFMGFLPGLQREFRLHKIPDLGIWTAPVLGVLFGLGWTPCIGPTLAAVQTLAFTEGSALRGALLSFVYCLGLGLPFVLVGLLFRRALGAISVVRRHSDLVMKFGGGLLVVIGVLLVTGVWDNVTIALRSWASGFGVPI